MKKRKLTIEEKSIKAFDKFLKTVPKEKLNKIIAKIDAMNFEGPTIDEYIKANFPDDL